MSASNTAEAAALDALFDGTTLYLSLHTADPGETGDQATNEAAYTGYSRQSFAYTRSGSAVTNDAVVEFGLCTALGSPETLTHFGIGTAASGGGTLYFSGALTSTIPMQTNFSPLVPASGVSVTAD